MAAEANRLLQLAEAVADGRPVDWDSAESTAGTRAELELIAQLRLLGGVADVHRSTLAEDAADVSHAVPDVLHGRRWGSLEIRERLGAGSFGTVYRAWDPRLDRDVALKLFTADSLASAPTSSATVSEGRMLARVSHPHVITVYGADQIDDRVGIWMELVSGSTLLDVFHRYGAFSAREAALVGVDLCGALAAVHREGLVHRDLKAQNVIREDGGRIVLMDFGAGQEIAAQARQGRAVGTPLYMAPELFAGGAATPQSDIYSLGVLLFWLVSGQFPVPGRTAAEIHEAISGGLRRRLRDERPDIPSGFVTVVERTLSSDPAARYQTAGALEEALAGFVADRAPARGRPLLWPVLCAGLVVATFAGAGLWRFSGRGNAGSSISSSQGIRSITVVPFTNASADAQDGFFAAGLADLLVSRLGSIKALQVITHPAASDVPNGSSGSSVTAPGRAQGILTGSVHRSGDQLRVNAKLLQAGTNALLWSDSYERPVDEAFALQGVIARDIARVIRITLSDEERSRLNKDYRPNALAQDEYLRARVLMNSAERAALIEARRLLEHAIALDSGYQLAHAALSRCYVALQAVGVMRPEEGAALARQAAEAALRIDDNAEARLALAYVSFTFDWDWKAAETGFTRSLDLNPSFGEARNRYSRFLSAAGRTEEAIDQATRGLELEPLSMEMFGALAMAQYYGRRYEAARATLTRAASLGATSTTILGRIESALGRHEEALVLIAGAYKTTSNVALLAELGRLEALLDRRDRAEKIAQRLRELRSSGSGYLFPGDLAFVLIPLGHLEEALDLLEVAVEERANRALWLRVDPRVDGVRAHPRFERLLARIGP